MEKVVENKVFNRRPPMFSCIRLRKRQQCCKPKIGGETTFTNKLSPESSNDQIQLMKDYLVPLFTHLIITLSTELQMR